MLDKDTSKKEIPKRKPEDRISIPSCTSESVNYAIECYTCRKAGIRRIYYGETSRLPYQRGKEHLREVEEGVISHPLVQHFWEEHRGRKQLILMRVTSSHLKPLERQVTESVNILEGNRNPAESLNLKSEWGGAKIPSLLIDTPKGLAKLVEETQEGEPSQETEEIKRRLKEAATRGQKRLEYMEEYAEQEEGDAEAQEEGEKIADGPGNNKMTGGIDWGCKYVRVGG